MIAYFENNKQSINQLYSSLQEIKWDLFVFQFFNLVLGQAHISWRISSSLKVSTLVKYQVLSNYHDILSLNLDIYPVFQIQLEVFWAFQVFFFKFKFSSNTNIVFDHSHARYFFKKNSKNFGVIDPALLFHCGDRRRRKISCLIISFGQTWPQ